MKAMDPGSRPDERGMQCRAFFLPCFLPFFWGLAWGCTHGSPRPAVEVLSEQALEGWVGAEEPRAVTVDTSAFKGADYQAEADQPWITFESPEGRLPASFPVTMKTAGLGGGLHKGTLALKLRELRRELRVPLALSLKAPSVRVSESDLVFTVPEGKRPDERRVRVFIDPEGLKTSWKVACRETWISVTPSIGRGDGEFRVSVDPRGASAPELKGTLVVSSPDVLVSRRVAVSCVIEKELEKAAPGFGRSVPGEPGPPPAAVDPPPPVPALPPAKTGESPPPSSAAFPAPAAPAAGPAPFSPAKKGRAATVSPADLKAEAASLAFLEEAAEKIDRRDFGREDLSLCRRLLNRGSSDRGGYPLRVALALYHRKLEKSPLKALRAAGPVVLSPDRMAAWTQAQAAGEKAARARGEPAKEAAARLYAPFPSPSEWDLEAFTVEGALEIARCLGDLHGIRDALEAINAVGAKFEGVAQAKAAECGGDLMMRFRRARLAVEYYEDGLEILKIVERRTMTEEERKALEGVKKVVGERIRRKLAEARRLWDIERYGEGWVLYRRAEEKRLKEREYLEALLLYEDLRREHAGGVYAEAAGCYRIKCLLALFDPGNASRASEAILRLKEETSRLQASLVRGVGQGIPPAALREMRGELLQKSSRIARMEGVPSGPRAREAAERSALEFLKEDEYGLYRGEVLVDLAGFAFRMILDPIQSDRLYRRAWEWLQKVEELDRDLSAFEVTGKVREVSEPPPCESGKNIFGSFKKAEVLPGMIVNRRTCGWYLDDLREKCALALGFLEFWRGRKKEAMGWYEKLAALDRETRILERGGEPNNYRRLKWGVEHGYLCAFPEVLATMTERQRFVVMVADFLFVTERFGEARELFERLQGMEFGGLKEIGKDYLHYGLADSMYWMGDRNRAIREFMKALERREGNVMERRAAYAAGNISSFSVGVDEGLKARGMELLRELTFSGIVDEYSCKARIVYGRHLVDRGRREEGLKVLRGMPKGGGAFVEYAADVVKEIENGER